MTDSLKVYPLLSSLKIRYSILLLLFGLARSSILSADDAMDRIAQAWNEHYGTFTRSDHYHYRCALTQRRMKVDFVLNEVPFPELTQYVLELFRLGPAARMDVAFGDDFSAIDDSGWIQIFDGRAGFVIQDASDKGVTIYSASCIVDDVRRATEPTADPLADVLGLATSRAGTSFGLGIGRPQDEFNVCSALAGGLFQIVSADTVEVELMNADGDRFTLSVPRRYALVRREWIWDTETGIRGSLVNRQWRQFSDGTWYPEVCDFNCLRSPTDDGFAEDLFTMQYRFEPLPATISSDFQIQANHSGMDITYNGREGDFRVRRLKAGETLDLTQVAHDKLSIRWDARDQPPSSILEIANVAPVVIFAVFTAVRWFPGRSVSRAWQSKLVWLSLLLIAMFVVLTHCAMWLYQGSTTHDHTLPFYSWTHNSLSDLGREYRYDDGKNFPANFVFQSALTIAGTSVIVYAFSMPFLFQRPASARLAAFAAVSGVLAGWSYIRIGWAPIDIYYDQHTFYVHIGFATFGIMCLLYGTALLLETDYSKLYGWSVLACCSLVGAYLVLWQFDGIGPLSDVLLRQAIAQKIVVYSQVICFVFQAKGGLNWLKRRKVNDSNLIHAAC